MNIIQVYKQFPTHKDCIKHLEQIRWQGKPRCPYCKSLRSSPMPKELRHHCNNCNTSYSVTVGTIFYKTKLDLQKWFLALSIVLNAKKGVSGRQLARHIEVNKDTGWFMGMRIRRAMNEQNSQMELLKGIVEADDTYIGGKGHKGSKRGRGTSKIPVAGITERGGDIRAKPVKKLNYRTLSSFIRRNIDIDSTILITDEFKGYLPFSRFVTHKTIDHSKWYADGYIHTNTIESFWGLFKRGIMGQYHHVSTRYLPMYLNEFCYRQNHRKDEDLFNLTISRALGVNNGTENAESNTSG